MNFTHKINLSVKNEDLPPLGRGSYVIVSELKNKQKISVGRLGSFFFSNGFYAYVGSAMGGLTARINRHLRKEKKLHWHIDYLLKYSSIIDIITGENNDGLKYQCHIARVLIKNLDCIKGFGCSDCKCSSHLFFSPKKKIILKHVLTAFNNV